MHYRLVLCRNSCTLMDDFLSPFTWAAPDLDAYLLHLTLKSFLTVVCSTSTVLVNYIMNIVKRRGIQGLMSCWLISSALWSAKCTKYLHAKYSVSGSPYQKESQLGHRRLMVKRPPLWKDVVSKNSLLLRQFLPGRKNKNSLRLSVSIPQEGWDQAVRQSGSWNLEIWGLWSPCTEVLPPGSPGCLSYPPIRWSPDVWGCAPLVWAFVLEYGEQLCTTRRWWVCLPHGT